MTKIISLVAALAIVSSTSFAATTKKTTTTTTTTTSPSSPVYSNNSSSASASDLLLSVDLGLGTAAEKFHFGVGFKAEVPVNLEGNHFRFGGQTGFYYGPSDPTTWIIPVLATAAFDFPVSSGSIRPYVGIGLGISIAHFSYDNVFGTGGVSGTNTDFMFQFAPGITFGNEKTYFIEIPLGTMASSFFILPTVGMRF